MKTMVTAAALALGLVATTSAELPADTLVDLTPSCFCIRTSSGMIPGWLDDVVRAKRPQRLPVVLTRQEGKFVGCA